MEDKQQILELLDQIGAGAQCIVDAVEGLKLVIMDSKADVEKAVEAVTQAEAKVYTFVDVRKAMAAKSHEGFTEQVKALIAKFGAAKLSDEKETDYNALMDELEGIK